MNAGRTSGVWRARVATLTSCSASLPIHQLHRHQQSAFTGDSAYNLIVRQKMVADSDCTVMFGLAAHSLIARTPTISLATAPQVLPWLPTQNTVKLYNRIWWRIVLHCFWQTFDCETAMKSCLWKMHVKHAVYEIWKRHSKLQKDAHSQRASA